MSAAHSPGPWVVCSADWSEKGNARYEISSNKSIGSVDARLIQAAPDLLQELINIANADTIEWDDKTEFEAWAKSRARAAIAKATGAAP